MLRFLSIELNGNDEQIELRFYRLSTLPPVGTACYAYLIINYTVWSNYSALSVISKERFSATEKSFHSGSKISPRCAGRNDNAVEWLTRDGTRWLSSYLLEQIAGCVSQGWFRDDIGPRHYAFYSPPQLSGQQTNLAHRLELRSQHLCRLERLRNLIDPTACQA